MVTITLLVLAALAWGFIRVQLQPLTRSCGLCRGTPPGDGKGNYHPCRRCGGNTERLRPAAWIMLKVGIPVPRATNRRRRHPMSVPKD